eukprot:TRINITY_DN2703_c0_g1_i1.p1 TRINITY_DN2703_c0_g1~~TRINITY_DN2703_c0_g1_i1.p1  ORF type:complete len:108 (+),score=14.56 TRINITY_DN2703_c0_g1_i1:72-395(+)
MTQKAIAASALLEEKKDVKHNAHPSIEDIQWRIDVTISTTALSRVFKPCVIMQLTLTDGTMRTFECSVDKFQDLRYNITKILKNMGDLEQHPAFQRLDTNVKEVKVC